MKDIEADPDRPWDYEWLGENIGITGEDIMNNLHLPWSPFAYSQNPNINWQFVQDHPGLKWNYNTMTLNPSITKEDILKNPHIEWDKSNFLMSRLTIDDVLENPEFPWEPKNFHYLKK
jgi:hypothetical protein